ncbi:DUF2752 domain-containing protein [Blastopirellula sp. J2-11]|uniref:DUF2752 domain-containing protein n=1 Tax=Blastopirellula sp. J2-11 TaxID=2943192 RepID=UPI0021C9E400|nr:DUF2752 domain-containing protein [Blastopirellula sp. J2-11]UUO06548.1 DUF2752 domain-containing protein [Blastopirellula sp. J2-11]
MSASGEAPDALDIAPLDESQEDERPERSLITFHGVMLGMALLVLIAALALSFQSGEKVYLPLLGAALPPSCAMKLYYGIDCPGCGLTRSFILLAHGDLPGSLAYNPSGVLLFGVVLFQIPYRLAQLWRIRQGRQSWNLGIAAAAIFSAIFAVMLVQWGVKFL